MNNEQSQADLIKKYLNLFFDWHRLILFCLLVAVSGGYAYYLNEPDVYESNASIMYQQQRINPSRMSPDDERRLEEMVNTVAEQVLSRSSLERVIREHDLYPEMRENMPIEDVIARMRNRDISVNVDRRRGNVFSVTYQGRDPEKTMRVTNTLASRFIEENLRYREERAAGTTRYIQEELRMSKEVLEKKEAEMRDYKLQYYNEMPDQRASNMSRLNSLQEQFQSTQSRINDLEQTRLLISEQIETRRNMERLAAGSVEPADTGRPSGGRDELSEARRQLRDMRSRYTPEHPAVRRAEARVRQLESEQAALLAEAGDGEEAGAEADIAPEIRDPRIAELTAQLREIELNLRNLRRDAEETRQRMAQYQEWIDAAPVREAEWSALTRDYDELRSYHDNLLAQSLSAEAAESLERRQQGSQFRVVDPAFRPTAPLKGSFLTTLIMAIGLGGVAGVGLVMGFSMLDTSFRDARDLEDYLQIPITCAVPEMPTPAEKRRKLAKNILWVLFFAAWIAAIGAATVYFYLEGAIFL